MRHAPRHISIIASLLAALLVALLVGGCAEPTVDEPEVPGAVEQTVESLEGDKPQPSQEPPPPMLRDPRSAVYSYMLWISYAYRTLNSELTSHAYTPQEESRVGSYILYNRQEKQAIDQRILKAEFRTSESVGNTATVGVGEEWAYRYIDITTGEYKSPLINISYDSTYTVVQENGQWRVLSVETSRTSENDQF